jgi:hypothetical protein
MFALSILALAVSTACAAKQPPASSPDEAVACTKDAKICPDGTTVGRSGPDCEFDPCPDED